MSNYFTGKIYCGNLNYDKNLLATEEQKDEFVRSLFDLIIGIYSASFDGTEIEISYTLTDNFVEKLAKELEIEPDDIDAEYFIDDYYLEYISDTIFEKCGVYIGLCEQIDNDN